MEAKEFKVGQKWRMRGGEIATIYGFPEDGNAWAHWSGKASVFRPDGCYWPDGTESPLDLATLVEDVAPEPAEYSPAPLLEIDPTSTEGGKSAVVQAGAPESQLIRAYNSGYKAGHHDTVEAQYTDIDQRDMYTYHADVVADMIADGTLSAPPAQPQPVAEPVESIDTPEFTNLMSKWDGAKPGSDSCAAYDAIVAHIDAKLAATKIAQQAPKDAA